MQNTLEHRIFYAMGITVHLTMIGVTNKEADQKAVLAEKIFKNYDERFSRFKETSELMALNQSNGAPYKVSIEMFRVLKKCVSLAKETEGRFDPSVGSVLASYGYGLPENFVPPSPLPTYRDISFNDRALEVTLSEGQILEPASMVKGIAIDTAGTALAGVPGFMINAGGDILTYGAFQNGTPWNVAIQDPRDTRAIVTVVGIENRALATSGVYQTKGEQNSRPWHHLVNMQTLKPTQGITSATVIAKTCEQADTEASLAILLGKDGALIRLEKLDLPYFLILDDGIIQKNKAFAELEISIQATH